MTEEVEIVENPAKKPAEIHKSSKFKRKRVLIPAILAVIGIILGLYYLNHAMMYESTDDAYIEGHNIPISPKVSGNIAKVYIDDNQNVKKGQLLVEIDPKDYQVNYEQALARLAGAIEKQKGANVNVGLTNITSSAAADQANSSVGAAKAEIQVADKQILQAKSNLAQANTEIDSAKAELELAQIDFNRYQKLYKKGVVSKQDFDRISTNYKTLKAKYDSSLDRAAAADSTLQSAYANKEFSLKTLDQAIGKLKGANTVSQQVSISDAQRRASSAEIKQLQAALEQAKLALSYTKIYAPKAGMITNKSVEEGAYIQIGQPLFSIIPDDRWVVANFKEIQLTNMKVGQPVFIKVDAYPNIAFKGRVDSIQSGTGSKSSLFPPENAVGSFVKVVQRVPVKITFTEKMLLNIQ